MHGYKSCMVTQVGPRERPRLAVLSPQPRPTKKKPPTSKACHSRGTASGRTVASVGACFRSTPTRVEINRGVLRVRFQIFGNACIKTVCKYQSCMVSPRLCCRHCLFCNREYQQYQLTAVVVLHRRRRDDHDTIIMMTYNRITGVAPKPSKRTGLP